MKRDRSGSGLPLVRRVFIDGQLAEFVHPTDGGDPFRRPVGASVKDLRSDAGGIASGEGSATIERSAPVQGQLVGRAVRADDAMLPIHVPLLRASCEGTGACCGLFHHVPATCEDRDAVRDLLTDDWDGPVPLPEMMFPAFDAAPEGPLNVVEVDGCCGFLRDDGLCAIHAQGGPTAKPQSCLAFPAALIACGDEWHASLRPECACLARTALNGTPLQADPASWAALRSLLMRVWEVPERIAVTDDRTIDRAEYLEWMRRTMAALRTTFDPLTALAGAIGRLVDAPPTPRPSAEWPDSVAADLEEAVASVVTTHSPKSPYRRSVEWGAEVARGLADGRAADPPWSRGRAQNESRQQASVAALVLHGHDLLQHPLLATAATDLLHVLWMGRASCAIREPEEVDSRLEATTTWIFLWRHLEWTDPLARPNY